MSDAGAPAVRVVVSGAASTSTGLCHAGRLVHHWRVGPPPPSGRPTGRFQALLADVGGTLVPDSLPEAPALRQAREAGLAAVLPELDQARIRRLLDQLIADDRAGRDRLDQTTDADIERRLASIDASLADRAGAVRRALSGPTGHEHRPFPGYRDLMVVAGRLGLRRVLVSNTTWTSDEDWWEWRSRELDLDGLLDGVVTSHSLGWRKPHRAMFDRALELAGCAAPACVFMGDREHKDVEPALALGMTVIRVAIQSPPSPTRAQHQVTSLAEAVRILTSLTSIPA